MKELMAKKPLGYGIGLSKAGNFDSREQMPYPPDSWLVSVWVERGAHLVDILVPASDIGITEEQENADGYEYTCQ